MHLARRIVHGTLTFAAMAAFLAPSSSCITDRPQLEREGPGKEGRQPPDRAWFAGQRMSSGEPIPLRARQRALEKMRHRGAGPATVRARGSWVFAGPTNIGGRLTALAVDPQDADHIWAGSAAGGIFETTNRGSTWTAVFDDQPLLPVGALTAHPTDSNIVYVGTGEANGAGYSYDGDGVYRTTDGGSTWQPIGLAGTRRIGRIAIDPQDPQRVFVAAAGGVYAPDTNRGVYRSVDGGGSWTQVLFVSSTAGAIDLAIDPEQPDRVYAAIWEHYGTGTEWVAGGLSSGIWRSEDGGDTWSRLANGLPAPGVGRIGLALAASSPQTVYALYLDDPGALIGVYKTTDAGATWSRVDTPGGAQQGAFSGAGYYFGQIRVDPANAQRVYLLDVYWTRSDDGGVTWTTATTGLHVDHHDLVILPGRLYMATDGGFYSSTNGGGTWIWSMTLPITQFYDLGIDPSNPLVRFGAVQDNGSIRTRTGGLSDWVGVYGGDGLQCEVDPTNGKRVYCEYQFGGIVRSSNGGNSFSSGVSGIATSDRRNWKMPLTHDPISAFRLYAGTYRVYRSTDGAQSWSPISGDLTNGPAAHFGGPHDGGAGSSHLASIVEGTITALTVSRLDTNVIWAGTDDGNIWVTLDGGGQWTQVDVPGRSEWVTGIAADPFSPDGAFVTFSGYRSGSPLPRIFRTASQGASWTDIGGGLPDVPVNCVEADPEPVNRGRLFAGTDLGVYVSDDFGATWSELGDGMPRVVVQDLELVEASRELFAGTHARSMYRYDLDQLGPADADGDGADNSTDCAAADPGLFAAPGEVSGLELLADSVTLTWDSAAPGSGTATLHQVVRGGIAGLPVGAGGSAGSEVCVGPGSTSTSVADVSAPAPGTGFWYLVRAVNACGVGGYGTTSAGQQQATAACP